MKAKILYAFCAIAAACAGCESSTAPPTPLAFSGGNDVLIAGSKAIVLASGSNSLYVLDLSDISASDRALVVVNEGNFGKSNSTVDVVLFHKNGQSVDTIVERNFFPDSSQRLIATIPMGLDAPNKMALISPTRLLVTRRNTTSAAIVDLTTNQIVDSVRLGEPSIAVAVMNNTAYITSSAQSYAGPFHVNVVNLPSLTTTARYTMNGSGEQAVADTVNNDVIIAAPGDYASYRPSYYFIDPAAKVISDSVILDDSTQSPDLTDGHQKYTIIGASIYAPFSPPKSLGAPIFTGSNPFYKGFYDATAVALYLGRYDFTSSSGKVDVYNASTGAYEWSFTTGIAPGHFAFYH
jgi:hypothetical protein